MLDKASKFSINRLTVHTKVIYHDVQILITEDRNGIKRNYQKKGDLTKAVSVTSD